ncbi:MAG: GNAT family N-acetyltransferase [Deltaproteobacteria bacterium]|nr:MAG: GNAT family N-acetyltransferase [Deltaproteobacteria bacterium]
MKLRTLRAAEREPLLDLLDGWELADGWRGRDFFRRYLELDARFADENVLVAEDAGRMIGCVQVFPREVRIAGAEVRLGGIGTVFTKPERRGRGVSRALLERAIAAMRERGMQLSLLFAGPIELYARLGWHSWGTRAVYRLDTARGTAAPRAAVEAFEPERHLEAVSALHAAYSGGLDGTVVRDAAAWQTSLRLAGNPDEEFWVARRAGRVCAYARATMLYGVLFLLEFGRAPDASDALADVVAHVMTPRTPDAFAPQGKTSAAFRSLATGCWVEDPELARALDARGIAGVRLEDPGAMLRCLDAPALARRLGASARGADAAGDVLRRILPPERFVFWPSDRF